MGWDLFGWSFSVIRQHKKLIWFPIFSGAAGLAAILLWFLFHPQSLLWLLPAYFVVSFLVVFFNCALACCAQSCLAGEEVSISRGLQQASTHVGAIAGWSVLSTTVGLLLRSIEGRASWAGKLARFLFGVAWGMTTYLVVPVLIAENRGPIASLKRSAQLVRDTWSDQIVAEIRFGWRGLVVFLPCLVLGAIGANGFPPLLPVAAAWFLLGIAVLTAARGIFEVALYRYAALHQAPANWPASSGILPRV